MTRTVWLLLFILTPIVDAFAQDSYTKGITALKSGDTTSAMTAFKDALSAGRDRARSSYQLAAIAFARSNIREAAEYIEQSLSTDDENLDALTLAGDIYIAKGDLKKGLAHYRRATGLFPMNPNASLAYGKALLRVDSADAAIIQLSRAKIKMGKNASVYEGLGDAYEKMEIHPMAITNYKEAIKYAPGRVALRMKLGRAYLDTRKYNEAVEAFAAVERIDSTYADAYIEQGRLFHRAKLFRKAVRPLAKYLKLQPDSKEGDSLYLSSLFNSRQYARLAEAAKKSIQQDSSSIDKWRMYAYALVDSRDYKTALVAFNGLLRRTSPTPEDQTKRGKAFFSLKLYDEALGAYESAISGDTTECDAYNDLGFIYMKKQEYARAAIMFEKRVACNPRSISAYLNGGTCYLVLAAKDPEPQIARAHARDLLLRARELNPDNLTIRFRLAQYYASADSLDNAKAEYDEVLKKTNETPGKYRKEAGEAHGQIAAYYFSKKQYARAIESFSKALASGYDNAVMHLNWGLALLQEIDPKGSDSDNRRLTEDAAKQFRRATQLDPGNAESHFWLGEALVRSRIVGDDESIRRLTAEACVEFKTVLKLNPRHQDARKEITRLGCQ
jgi:tetratricopeptide (TPR) repeat protein